jgi:CysZ protein
MGTVTTALIAALRDLREPRILALGLLPPFAAILVWAGLAWAFADDWARLVADGIANTPWLTWIGDWGLASVFIWGSGIAAIALLLPLMLITAALVTDLVAMPVIVPLVGDRHYPRLERRTGGTVAGSIWNAGKAVVLFALLWAATLPLWLTGVGALVLPVLLSAHFNQRLFRYDALAEHASAEEFARILRTSRGDLFLIGILLSLLLTVPLVNLLVPVLSALAFTHFCLARLERVRGSME